MERYIPGYQQESHMFPDYLQYLPQQVSEKTPLTPPAVKVKQHNGQEVKSTFATDEIWIKESCLRIQRIWNNTMTK